MVFPTLSQHKSCTLYVEWLYSQPFVPMHVSKVLQVCIYLFMYNEPTDLSSEALSSSTMFCMDGP